MTGYTKEELIGTPSCGRFCLKSETFCSGLDSNGFSLLSGEVYITRKDGTVFPAIKTVAKTQILGQEYLLETIVDISEQKRIEQLKEDVNRIVRHDLKSPVIGVINASTVALMDESTQGEAREMLEVIKNKGNQILNMIGMSMPSTKWNPGHSIISRKPWTSWKHSVLFLLTSRNHSATIILMFLPGWTDNL